MFFSISCRNALPHSLLLSPHPLVRCISREDSGNPLRYSIFWVTCRIRFCVQCTLHKFCDKYCVRLLWFTQGREVWPEKYIIYLFALQKKNFKIRWTCTTEGSIFQNLTGQHAPGTLLRGQSTMLTNPLFTHACSSLKYSKKHLTRGVYTKEKYPTQEVRE